jgi:hypothetical protein
VHSRLGPQCIIINDYGTPTWRQKRKFLQTHPVTRNLPAVRHGCILPLSYDQLTPGPRNAGAVEAIARWLHPQAFGLPGRHERRGPGRQLRQQPAAAACGSSLRQRGQLSGM